MSLIKRKTRPGKQDRLKCSAVIAAAGSSKRMNGGDKLFLNICGAPVLSHTLAGFQKCGLIDEIIVVAHSDMLERVIEICKEYCIDKAAMVIVGGSTRLDSVRNGVLAVSKENRLIAIHDGARPCVDIDTIERAIVAASEHNAAAPAIPVSSTIKKVINGTVIETVDRESLFEIQTPQVFDADLIKAALANAANKSLNITDDCMAVELLGHPVHITEGSRNNIKLTTREDMSIAEAILLPSNMPLPNKDI
ncbi:MAG: 2-C-methyl-D-erythritol 4-phosphate cytidylyltransferase [Oscillospiraceae bacterium]|jgi:2-C-methyl-D-erythritol 4-phosphate cytidylyltransferase|nr:2-C-methyl-D-erythritol 4-phosphate cytidylyltransferase [Oscillospiraceae bacterium]